MESVKRPRPPQRFGLGKRKRFLRAAFPGRSASGFSNDGRPIFFRNTYPPRPEKGSASVGAVGFGGSNGGLENEALPPPNQPEPLGIGRSEPKRFG